MKTSDYIETWTPYTMPPRPAVDVWYVVKPVMVAVSDAEFGGVSAERINDVLCERNPPHTREEIRAAKAQLEAVMREKGLSIPNEQ